jgi:hypothetical protein
MIMVKGSLILESDSVKVPFESVTEPLILSLTLMLAPSTGSPEWEVITVPVIFTCWAKSPVDTNNRIITRKFFIAVGCDV